MPPSKCDEHQQKQGHGDSPGKGFSPYVAFSIYKKICSLIIYLCMWGNGEGVREGDRNGCRKADTALYIPHFPTGAIPMIPHHALPLVFRDYAAEAVVPLGTTVFTPAGHGRHGHPSGSTRRADSGRRQVTSIIRFRINAT